ncbi:MAG: hypothetical protein ABW213_17215 [Tardiphaga sp.]|jgi:hypothetical protein
MRMPTAAALVAVFSLVMPAIAAAQDASPPTANVLARPGARIKTVQVIDVQQLPDPVKSHVLELAAKASDDDTAGLRKSIDGTPAAAAALKGKGVTSAQIIAADLSDGQLTLFSKTAK